jgi:hypothetical protein
LAKGKLFSVGQSVDGVREQTQLMHESVMLLINQMKQQFVEEEVQFTHGA